VHCVRRCPRAERSGCDDQCRELFVTECVQPAARNVIRYRVATGELRNAISARDAGQGEKRFSEFLDE
jgi:hypothetical protein